MAIVPKKYHTFISPPLRRVFLGDDGGRAAVIEDLNAEIETLQLRDCSPPSGFLKRAAVRKFPSGLKVARAPDTLGQGGRSGNSQLLK
jgi:hypothetical protein